ncbi:hypothetical protein WN944_016928 [Citrus x changshan-huyou]|uniref:Uncharacterized protein n=1 Tax=Citrus x changshan-huyou TaxID=2935761 RepID=A0AAP0MC05_9ROSI
MVDNKPYNRNLIWFPVFSQTDMKMVNFLFINWLVYHSFAWFRA